MNPNSNQNFTGQGYWKESIGAKDILLNRINREPQPQSRQSHELSQNQNYMIGATKIVGDASRPSFHQPSTTPALKQLFSHPPQPSKIVSSNNFVTKTVTSHQPSNHSNQPSMNSVTSPTRLPQQNPIASITTTTTQTTVSNPLQSQNITGNKSPLNAGSFRVTPTSINSNSIPVNHQLFRRSGSTHGIISVLKNGLTTPQHQPSQVQTNPQQGQN